jgi:hypothetical protein
MKDIIKKVLDECADCQINLASPAAREILAEKIAAKIEECDDAFFSWLEDKDKGLWK